MTEILTHDQIVEYAYYLVSRLLDINWSPNAKLKLLEAAKPYFEQIARAESEACRRSNDETLTDFERSAAGRNEGILNIAAGLLNKAAKSIADPV